MICWYCIMQLPLRLGSVLCDWHDNVVHRRRASKLSHIQGKHFIKSSEALLFLLVSSISGSIHSLYIIKSTVGALSVCAVRLISTSGFAIEEASQISHSTREWPFQTQTQDRDELIPKILHILVHYTLYLLFFWSTETTATLNSVCWSS